MADITLHSGSFCDRNNNEISITFFKRTSTPVMTVDPTALSFTSNGGTKQLRVSNYTGTLSISVTGGTGWLSRTQSTSSGVRTYTFTATANTSTTMRNATITLTDSNSTVTVGVTQAGVISSISLSTSILSFGYNQETKTMTVTWTGGHTPTYNFPSWCTVTANGSTSPMTLTVTAAANTGDARSAAVTFTNGISSANLQVTQQAAATMYVLPNTLSFSSDGGSDTVTAYFTGSETLSYTIGSSGTGWLTGQAGTPSQGEQTFTFTTSQNSSTSVRSATITFTYGNITAQVTVEQAGTTPITITVDKPVIDNVVAGGGTDTVTVTYNGQGYITPSYQESWIDVRYQSQPTSTTVQYQIVIDQNVQGSRSATITFTGSLGGSATTTVNQVAASNPWTVTPSTITNVDYQGHTYNLLFTGTPNIGMGYEFDPVDTDWLGVNITAMSSATVTVSANSGSSRTGVVKFYKYDDHSIYITVTVTQNAQPAVQWTVIPSSIPSATASGLSYQVSISGAPSGGMGYDVIYGSGNNWITITNFSNSGCTLTTSANTDPSSRSATVKFYDLDDLDHYITLSITQDGTAMAALSVRDVSMSFVAEGERKSTIVENIVGTLTHTEPSWITLNMSGEGGTRLVSVHASANPSSTARSGAVNFDDDRQSPVSMAVSQVGVTPALSMNPSYINDDQDWTSENVRITSPNSGSVNVYNPVDWVSVSIPTSALVSYNFRVEVSNFVPNIPITSDVSRHTELVVTRGSSRGTFPITQTAKVMVVNPTEFNFTAESQSSTLEYVSWTFNLNNGVIASTVPSWVTVGTPTNSGGRVFSTITVASNTSTEPRTAVISACESNGAHGVWSMTNYTINQAGASAPAASIAVSPDHIDFPYTNDAETLTVSGVPSGGYSTSISYNTGASGWLNLVSTAYNIIVTASTTTYPSSRTATLTVTNASVPSDSVAIPITQAGNPQVLSVTPNAWTYPSSLGTHSFTVIYNASGSITTSVAYEREEGEEELDWLEVELVEHEEGSETWIYSIDVGPNNTGSGREAMVTFTGDGGGADEVTVYQQP